MTETRCPYLGMQNDSQVCFSYPSEQNTCYRDGPAAMVDPAHQAGYCLSGGYIRCPLYERPSHQSPLPAPQAQAWSQRRLRAVLLPLFALLIIASAVGSVLFWVGAAPASMIESNVQLASTATHVGGFLIFIDGTPILAGAPVRTNTPESLPILGRLLDHPSTTTPTATPFMPLPTSTPVTPTSTFALLSAVETPTATVISTPTPSQQAISYPTFVVPQASTTHLLPTFTSSPTPKPSAAATIQIELAITPISPTETAQPANTATQIPPTRTPHPTATAAPPPTLFPPYTPGVTEIPTASPTLADISLPSPISP